MENEVSRAEERIGNGTSGAVVATLVDQVIGVLFFDVKSEGNRKALYVEQVAVIPHCRRLGTCSSLLDWSADVASQFGCQYTFLLVYSTNAGAISCYQRNGFIVRDSGDIAPRSEDPMIIRMERDLTPPSAAASDYREA
jgi:ribosomal protein S18 acetylase RimI-like enzyme